MVSFLWDKANSADPDQTPQNVASDQGLHRLLTACSILNLKNKPSPILCMEID